MWLRGFFAGLAHAPLRGLCPTNHPLHGPAESEFGTPYGGPMESTEGRRQGPWVPFVAWVVAYIASRAIFAASGFRYQIFQEPFNLGKLIIDLGVWAVLFGAAWWIVTRLFYRS